MKPKLEELVGPLVSEDRFTARMRFHQGWWRAFVLCEEPGPHPKAKGKRICSAIYSGEKNHLNFVSDATIGAVTTTLEERSQRSGGIIDEDRLFNNLLSSQPLCFNFFGELKSDTRFALDALRPFFPQLTRVNWTRFEFRPEPNHTADNSAFDVAFEVEAGEKTGIIGLECKFTDSFSAEEFDKPEYQDIWERTGAFSASYDSLKAARFNQLFRNQLMAEAAVLNGDYDFTHTGLFCHPEDDGALAVGEEFRTMLNDGISKFRVITYGDFIETIQRTELSWQRREMIMMLWARYLGARLSQNAFE